MNKDDIIRMAREALDALEELNGWQSLAPPLVSQAARRTAVNLRAALEQPEQEQEPVAWLDSDGFPWSREGIACRSTPDTYTPLYTHPPRREWQTLTDEEIDQITTRQWGRDFMVPAAGRAWGRAIEQALKEKNYE